MRTNANTSTIPNAVRGHEQTFIELYNDNLDKILNFVAARVSDRATAEDLTAAVFARVWEKLGSFIDRGIPMQAWLFRIARNAVIDSYRTAKEVAPLEVVANVSDGRTNVAYDVETRLELERVANSLQVLTNNQREVFMLLLVQGFSTREVARTLKKGEGAVRALKMRGLQALSQDLQVKEKQKRY